MKEGIPKTEKDNSPEREKGANVTIDFKLIRHGERTKDGELIELGREITRDKAKESSVKYEDYDAVKAIGSPAGPEQYVEDANRTMARSVETAHIYAKEISGDRAYVTRDRDILSYETLKSKRPYDHEAVYNSYLPDNFEELDGEERVSAAKTAQQKVINYIAEMDTPEALAYKEEIAGSFAVIVEHYQKMTKKLPSGYRLLTPAGSHGGTMEFFILETAESTDDKGGVKIGMTVDQIGGDFNPSEAYTIRIQTDENGKQESLVVTFDNPDRPEREIILNNKRVHELANIYRKLHR